MTEYYSRYHEALAEEGGFAISWELVPGRGAVEKAQDEVIRCAEQAARGQRVHALSLTDNPGGNPALSAEMLGAEITRLGLEPLVHFTCKDKNRNQLEALLYGLERASVRNLLVMSGDYTVSGYCGRAKPVFDLDPAQLLGLIGALNEGLTLTLQRSTTTLEPTHFYAGAVVSSFKALESEQMGQYYKLKKKLEAGARYVVTQVGFDARKYHEVLQMVSHLGFGHIPIVGNIYVLNRGAARLMNRNRIPGCVVPDKLVQDITSEGGSRAAAKAASLERAAKMYAFMRGMGFAGVQIGGHGLEYEDVEHIIDRGDELLPNWRDVLSEFDYPMDKGWYYFEEDEKTGLNTEAPVDRSQRPPAPLAYYGFRLLHNSMFEPRGFLFRPMRALARVLDGSRLEDAFTRVEHLGKAITNDCLHCGDCGLGDVAYICPTSQCPKGQRNGPCGGSHLGWCEVYPDEKKCIYVRAYQRLKHYGEEDELADHLVPPVDYDLFQRSSWLNYFAGRDHTAKRMGVSPFEKDKAAKE